MLVFLRFAFRTRFVVVFLSPLVKAFAFSIIFFCVLFGSYLVDDFLPVSRYDFISISLLVIYAGFFVCKLRSKQDCITHVTVHILGSIFEYYKVGHGAWVYPETGALVFFGVPFYSGFMYTALVDCISQLIKFFQLRIVAKVSWYKILLLCVAIYANFFLVHITRIDMRYVLVFCSVLLLYHVPITIAIKNRILRIRLLPIMIGFACIVWVAENIATFSGAWLYKNQLERWYPVSLHKLVSWYLLGQFFAFVTLYIHCNQPNKLNTEKLQTKTLT